MQGTPVSLLNPKKKYLFTINEISDDYIKIDKLYHNKLKKQMFLSVYDYVRKSISWVRIGASRVNTLEDTVEGLLKREFFNNNPGGLSTAAWISAILVYSDVGVEFNNKTRGQKLRFRK
jgi:hypothetical protein